ncbi:tannase/feruloyl esterase family alpha/beta hydrolase [Sphingomonas sp. MG17]|uniref:Tannase/feruloyl esterase family alpha/beta hydrolase n=1 Tax=Sphingomonas tagetis TaxID=2949092 RepID=A0A9X2HEV7_9SPHN|nr:tannase/feruloyl esterase family alpha/beta hydrolase [Sphingomonas tagetis]MCP3729841.1 tannase/feruloyl esterase family alpha/beta hydrolase [Sphingomonas tagetis]
MGHRHGWRQALAGIALCVAFSSPVALARGAPQAGADGCQRLARLTLPHGTRITLAEPIAASADKPWTSPEGFYGRAKVEQPFCRVGGTISPVPDSRIGFEVWLPLAPVWNGRFYGTAVGASMGAFQYASLPMPLSRGFAAMTHDNGHKSANFYEQSWAFDAATRTVRRTQVVDFASRAQHLATVIAKQVAATYYGRPVQRAYYLGCSQGGHHGMMEAQRYPGDYDGIVAGAHGGDWSRMMAAQAWAVTRVVRDNRAGGLSKPQLAAVSRHVLARCDRADGLADGQIEDPRLCRFDPAELACGAKGTDTALCLNPAQVAATREIYRGPHTSAGRRLAPGFAPGSETYWEWHDQTQPLTGSYYDFYRLVMQRNPDWNLLSMDWDRDIDSGRRQWSAVYDAINPDLRAFDRRGGKLILHHGWSDGLITPYLSIDAYQRIQRQMGARATGNFARLFMIPGMGHCEGGPVGATRKAHEELWLTAIQNWVERGVAPDATNAANTLIGSGKIDGGTRRRPWCPFPKIARYKGSGDVNDPRNFSCRQAS